MRLLLDTQVVIWLIEGEPRLPAYARGVIEDPTSDITLSVASLWEIAIKFGRRRPDFRHAPGVIRAAAQRAGWKELPIRAEHVIDVANLPAIHGDPFDRLLVAQARVEGLVLLSADATLLGYGDPVRRA